MILTLNAGSSSLKFSIRAADEGLATLAVGQVENLGRAADLKARFGHDTAHRELGAADHESALASLLELIGERLPDHPIVAVGHRIVHGGTEFTAPVRLDAATLRALDALSPLAPLHQPHNLAAAHAAAAAFPEAVQIGCFDTAFHGTQSWLQTTFALPRRFHTAGLRRYGFHGLSYASAMTRLRDAYPDVATGRLIVAHLGNGASMCAIRAGRSVSSTMGLSPLDGLPMGTRCGQIDPAALLYLMETEALPASELTRLLYQESGLLGLSGESHDMRTLEASTRPEAKAAIDYFVARAQREIGALAAVLEGIDALVFTGGIGEHSAMVRSRICDRLGWLGIQVDAARNARHAGRLNDGSPAVLVVPCDEERVIAAHTLAHL